MHELRRKLRMNSIVLTVAALLPAMVCAEEVQFVRDIQPILADNCFACHGPDAKSRQAELRLDQKHSAFEKGNREKPPIHAGKPDHSAIYERMTSTDPDVVMPPPATGKKLTPVQIAKIRKWIEMGAKWQEHWAFVAPNRPTPPMQETQASNPIDAFIRARLAREHLSAAQEADRPTLIRRLSLDLLGLPPTLKEIDDFTADNKPGAYERLVDRLLASPHYGERMAQHWLDVARYADTNGYHIDNHRDMWKWRDWVINAFNSNKRFNDFTVEQIAGDMLPKATIDQRVASGFNRNCMVNFEGGAIEEEYATKYVVDRVVTTSTVFLGLTMGCCECHDHKYDPLSQKEFYQFYAFFNNVPEKGLDGQRSNPVPSLALPTPEENKRIAEIDARLQAWQRQLVSPHKDADERQRRWEKMAQSAPSPDWALVEVIQSSATGGTKLSVQKDGSLLASGLNPPKDSYTVRFRTDVSKLTAIRLEAFPDPSLPAKGPGRAHNGNFVLTKVAIRAEQSPALAAAAKSQPNNRQDQKDSKPAPAKTQTNLPTKDLKGVAAKEPKLAPAKDPTVAATKEQKQPLPAQKVEVQQVNKSASKITQASKRTKPHNVPILVTSASFSQAGFEVANSLEGKRNTGWAVLPQVGKHQSAVYELETPIDCDKDTVIAVTLDFKSQFSEHGLGRFRITACDDPMPHDRSAFAGPVASALATPVAKRTPAQSAALRDFYRASYWPEGRSIRANILRDEKARESLKQSLTSSMVMEEMKPARMTNILLRGDYRSRGEVVHANVPAILPPLPPGTTPDRLALAKWMVDPKNPLVARVTVNRYWQQLFGYGLVRTSNDFGTRGELPSHPELLDWLATEYIQSGWDTKRLLKLILTSAVYRQSSILTPQSRDHDPENRLLARGPRFRLEAEAIRDNALAISGLFAPKIGGPSVKPYQPPGIWEEMAFGNEFSSQKYEVSTGQDLYRRGLYTYWKRSMPYPSFITFDAPNREICSVQRPRTNTPLQALVLLNDPVYLEAARALGQRMVKEGGADVASRITFGFRLCTSRAPSSAELAILEGLYRRKLDSFKKDPKSAIALLKSGGLSVADNSPDAPDLAAWSLIGNTLLNLSETITKG